MKSDDEWHAWIADTAHLPPAASNQLREIGFTVIPGPGTAADHERLSAAYDRAVADASPADVHVGASRSSTRIDDFVNRGPAFDDIYIHLPLLAACREVIGGPFKLS